MAEKQYYDTINDRSVYKYILKRGKLDVGVVDHGARIDHLRFDGVDVALGFDSIKDYCDSATYAGATIGRVANRIAKGKFAINDKTYSLACNNGKNHLHGGNVGFDKRMFDVIEHADDKLVMRYVSADGEEGYPGKLTLTVTFTIDGCKLLIGFIAESDADTLWCPTNHLYFNLDGAGSGTCLKNKLFINSDTITPVDEGLIPTGEKKAVDKTFDFRVMREIGEEYSSDELKATNGYDHNYILRGSSAACEVKSDASGISMRLYTDLPCLQFYSGGGMHKCKGHDGLYDTWYGFCLEPQFTPNAINAEDFDKPILKKGEVKSYNIEYVFSRDNGHE